ncbi:patatin-like phospholipase family protein [Thalassotalea euphylliae]|uniref:patatin-like phospholipase family protein n=1 Tax=Thalassotalea euphylliae TaxID=1655234 RepID=UPI00363E26A4
MTSEQQKQQLLEQEQAWIAKRRPDQSTEQGLTGVALSGGGIRSATFNLGVLQALEKHDVLEHVDITSSVSGGGYMASCLSWFNQKLDGRFPFGTDRKDHDKLGGAVLAWLRSHASFLTPGNGITKLSLMTAILTGTFINLVILIPAFVWLFFLSSIQLGEWLLPLREQPISNIFGFATLFGFIGFGLCILLMFATAISTGACGLKKRTTEYLRSAVTKTAGITLGFLIVGHLPWLHDAIYQFTEKVVHSSISVAIVSAVLASMLIKRSNQQGEDGPSLITGLLVRGLIYVFCLSTFTMTYHLATLWLEPMVLYVPVSFYIWTALSVTLAICCDINLISMHGYYRNRLRDTFMPTSIPDTESDDEIIIAKEGWKASQLCYLAEFTADKGPYHIINCNLELIDSKHPRYKSRCGDNFTFTPVMAGSSATGYISTGNYMTGNTDLASVTAISGAAVATNTALTRGRGLNFVMALFNLRLGCWLPNPKTALAHTVKRPLWYNCIFRDMLGKGLDENQPYIHLSDGGHFENLGVYELVKRKAKVIISIDAGADPLFKFHDLAKMTELIRVDFGAKLKLDTSPLLPGKNGISAQAYVVGELSYEDGTTAEFLYIKSAMIAGLSPDVVGYKHENPTFPDQTTADQFFDEYQFEAYRELGFQITHQMLKEHRTIIKKH